MAAAKIAASRWAPTVGADVLRVRGQLTPVGEQIN
jgi:hypothetical protein